jgi:hypothetical protein
MTGGVVALAFATKYETDDSKVSAPMRNSLEPRLGVVEVRLAERIKLDLTRR